ncbi:hypothetical protein HRbin39_00022 [bacterium HR39]|nr:hypothetical protein HRbin39_00022 [bacterium HR39]
MCSLVVRFAPASEVPLLLAANRDEREERPWDPPARHWPDRPEVVAGRDREAGGSWLGVSDFGLVAAVLNRAGSLGPAPDRRSRGELVLEALDHVEAAAAARALACIEPTSYRPFNLFVADVHSAFWIRSDGHRVTVRALDAGVHMLTSRELDDPECPRIRAFLPRFRETAAGDPLEDPAHPWRRLLAEHTSPTGDPVHAMCIHTDFGYGSVSASLIALPADPLAPPRWLFAPGKPCRGAFAPVDTAPGAGRA